MKEFLVYFIKEEKDADSSVGEARIIRAANAFYLKNKILEQMKNNDYIGFFFAKKSNVGDIDALNFATHNCDEYEKYLSLKDAYDYIF